MPQMKPMWWMLIYTFLLMSTLTAAMNLPKFNLPKKPKSLNFKKVKKSIKW